MPDYDQTILNHYKEEAMTQGASPCSTMADTRVRELETQLICNALSYVSGPSSAESVPVSIVDVGCGNGYTLSVLSHNHPFFQYTGFEYTPELLAIAQKRFSQLSKVSIKNADIRDRSSLTIDQVDFVICQRVLINLLDPEDQQKALRNIVDIVKVGGCILFIEAFQSGLENLNAARQEFDLPEIPPAHHNLNLKDDFFSICPQLSKITAETVPANFLSTHHFVSRVLHPLVLGAKPFSRNSAFVSFFSQALQQDIGDFSAIRSFFAKRIR